MEGLFADWAKLYGPVLVFKALWQKTGLKRIISEYAKERKFDFDLSSVIFSMVLGRLLDPLSKLSTQKWLKREVYDEEIDWHFFTDFAHFYWIQTLRVGKKVSKYSLSFCIFSLPQLF